MLPTVCSTPRKHDFQKNILLSFFPLRLTANEPLNLLEEYGSDLSVFLHPIEEADAVSDQDSDISDDGAKGDVTLYTEKSLKIWSIH